MPLDTLPDWKVDLKVQQAIAVDLLRTAEERGYRQNDCFLKMPDMKGGYMHCAMGVLAEEVPDFDMSTDARSLYWKITQHFGLYGFYRMIPRWNDEGMSFTEIADRLEEKLKWCWDNGYFAQKKGWIYG